MILFCIHPYKTLIIQIYCDILYDASDRMFEVVVLRFLA